MQKKHDIIQSNIFIEINMVYKIWYGKLPPQSSTSFSRSYKAPNLTINIKFSFKSLLDL